MLFVDVSRAGRLVEGGVKHQVAKRGLTTQIAESTAELPPPPREGAAPPKPVVPSSLGEKLARALEHLDGSAYADELERLEKADPVAFTQALHAAFEPAAVSLADWTAVHFLTTVARNFLYRLELSKERWLRVVLAAAWAENNAVLDVATKNAKGADAGTLAAAAGWVETLKTKASATVAASFAAALERCR